MGQMLKYTFLISLVLCAFSVSVCIFVAAPHLYSALSHLPAVVASEPSFTTCSEAVALLDANLLSDTYGSLEGSYADFHDLAADRPAVVSIAHPDWIGVLSAAVSII